MKIKGNSGVSWLPMFSDMETMILIIKENRIRTSRNKDIFYIDTCNNIVHHLAQCTLIISKLIFNCYMTYYLVHRLFILTFFNILLL